MKTRNLIIEAAAFIFAFIILSAFSVLIYRYVHYHFKDVQAIVKTALQCVCILWAIWFITYIITRWLKR